MKFYQTIFLIAMIVAICMTTAACGSDSNDVPSLSATPTPGAADEILDIEAKMMEFTECLRNEGLEVLDPVVDSDGFIQKPDYAEGFEPTKEESMAAFDVCSEIIENITFEKKEIDRSGQVDQFVELAVCMRQEGFNIEDPTVEALDIWMTDFKTTIDWDDPETMETYEGCMGGTASGNNGKGK